MTDDADRMVVDPRDIETDEITDELLRRVIDGLKGAAR